MLRQSRGGRFSVRVLIGAAVLGSACRSRPNDIEVARIIVPVRARLYVGSWQRDSTTPYIRTLGLDVADHSIPVRCSSAGGASWTSDPRLPTRPLPGALVGDETGARIAYRCAPGDPWSIVYRGATYGFVACGISAPPGPVDWSRVPTLEEAAVALLSCPEPTFATLQAAVLEHGGPEAVSRLVADTAVADLAPHGMGSTLQDAEQEWLAAFRAAPPATQTTIGARLRSALLTGGAPPVALRRAATVVDLTDPSFTSEVLRARLATCGDLDASDGCAMLLRRWAAVDAPAASEFTCASLPTEWTRIGPTALATLARAGLHCAAFAQGHEQDRCARLVGGRTCPTATNSHECSLDEQRAEVAAELAYRVGVPYPWASEPVAHTGRLNTSAALATGVSCAGGTPTPM
ncbi:MAG: hypothetical protein WCJ30_18840 [Deltaproteobacteria bacterium]